MNPFDIQEWKPTFCKTEKELNAFWEENQIARKKIIKINAIGIALNMQDYSLDERKKKTVCAAGVTFRFMQSVDKKWYNKIQLNAELELWEPIVFVLEDYSTVELMIFPDGILGVSVNQIDPDTTEGINHGTCDAGILFSKMLSRKCISSEFYHRISYQSSDEGEKVQREEYAFVFKLTGNSRLRFFIRAGFDSTFTCGLISQHQFNWEQNIHKIYLEKINEALKDIQQIPILEGTNSSGYFMIVPTMAEDQEIDTSYAWETRNYYAKRIMIEENAVKSFLFYFLYKYLDKDYNKKFADRDSCNNAESKPWSSPKLYSYPTIKEMLQEIEEKARLLQEDFENPELNELIDKFSVYYFIPYEIHEIAFQEDWCTTTDRIAIRDNLSIALDFYARFVSRVRKLMERNPDCECICFSGP